MKSYYLSGEDITKINRLISTANSIDLIYNKLYELEINNQKDTDEYKKQLSFLNIAIDLENRLYNKLNFDEDKTSATIKYLVKFEFHKDYIAEEECLLNQDYKNINILRITRKLLNKLESTEKGFKEIYLDNDEEFIGNSLIFVQKQTKILKEISKDIYNSYLLFLKEYINDKNNSLYKNDFIKSKYIFSFIYENIEDQMLKNNYEISDDLYLSSRFLSDIFGVSLDMYNYMKDNYSQKVLEPYISDFIKIRDLDYNNKRNYICAIFNCCYIRACLLNMSDEAINDANYEFHELIESEEYIKNYSNEKISENLIIECFKKVKTDRQKAKKLSFRIK